jgi:cytochrome P450
MIAAAIDTSSVLSEWAMSELVKSPRILKKAQEEIEAVVGRDRRVGEEDLGGLKYLKCIVKESFRMHPSGPFIIPHVALRDTTVSGYYVPKGTEVLINVYALGRDKRIWSGSEPVDEFVPERWMDDDKVEIRDDALRILPFSLGRRKCPGAPLGQCMVLLALASLIQAFDWSLPPSVHPDSLDMMEGSGLTMPRAQPLVAIATPRLPPHLYQ